jgi:hypothetical protein
MPKDTLRRMKSSSSVCFGTIVEHARNLEPPLANQTRHGVHARLLERSAELAGLEASVFLGGRGVALGGV